MKPIAHIRTDLPQKFGIPRNSFLAPHLQGRIVFEPEYAKPAAVKGLEGFSHIWLIWEFQNGATGGTATDVSHDTANAVSDQSPAEQDAPSWSPTVRPPRLGGAQRVGVFATRSPFRPNPLGLSCAKLERVAIEDDQPVLYVSGADLRDMTPIYDIKPYIPFADCHPEAHAGFVEEVAWKELQVNLPETLASKIPENKREGLVEVLRQDPRRAGSKHEPDRIYHLAYAGFDVSFRVDDSLLEVVNISQIAEHERL